MRRAAVFMVAGVIATAGPSAGAEPALPGPVPATVLRVVDGDTLTVRAHIWIGQVVETNVRLSGIDTPEVRAKCQAEAELARDATTLTARLAADGVLLTDIRPDKYGNRINAVVRAADGTDIAEALIKAGLARRYGGAQRQGWCGS